MLPLYSGSTSNKYVYPSNTQRVTRIPKKWRKTYKNILHHTRLSTFIVAGFSALLLLFIIISIVSLARSDSASVEIGNTVPNPPPEALVDTVKDDQVNINIVEDKTKDVKLLDQDTPSGSTMLDRRNRIRSAFVHAYGGYEFHAFGYDELRPVTNRTNSSWGGFGVTIFDALDTLLLMRLDDMFERALKFVLSIDFEKMWRNVDSIVGP